MYFKNGHMPAVFSICVLTIGLATTSVSAAGDPLTLDEAERAALHGEPGYEELLSYASALAHEADAADDLPDPTLRIGMVNFPVDGSGFSAEPMTQAQLGFRQAFPRRSVRDAAADRFRALSSVRRLEAETRLRFVLESVRTAWLDVYFWQKAATYVGESRAAFSDLVEVTRSLYAEGRRTQHDVVRAQLELSRIDDRLIAIAESRVSAQARLSEWLGQDAYRDVAPAPPEWSSLPALELFQEALHGHPALLAAVSAIDAGDASVNSARERRKAGWALDVGYGYRDYFAPDGVRRSDMVTVNVVLDLPFLGRKRHDQKLAAALGDRSAAQSAKKRVMTELESKLRGEYARWNELTRRIALYESNILGLAESQADIALSAYRSDSGDFADVTRSYVDALDTRIEYTRIQVERAQRYAALASLGGLSQ